MVQNRALTITGNPISEFIVGEHLQVQEVDSIDLDRPLGKNAMLLETLLPVLRSVHAWPAARSKGAVVHRCHPSSQPLVVGALSRILQFTNKDYPIGDVIFAYLPVQEYNLWTENSPLDCYGLPTRVDTSNPKLDIRHYLGAFDMPRVMAYSSLYKIGKPKTGEIIVVSSVAGAIGQLVGQFAKDEGLKVLGSVGSDEKLDFIVNELGFHGGRISKKESNTKDAIDKLTDREGNDIYYE